jgi:hypothetical protein
MNNTLAEAHALRLIRQAEQQQHRSSNNKRPQPQPQQQRQPTGRNSMLANIHEQRLLQQKQSQPAAPQPTQTRPVPSAHSTPITSPPSSKTISSNGNFSLQQQLRDIRNKHKNQWRNTQYVQQREQA